MQQGSNTRTVTATFSTGLNYKLVQKLQLLPNYHYLNQKGIKY